MFHSGDVIRTLRLARGWTQKTLAAKAGVSDMTISKIERSAKWNYRRDTLLALAQALNTTPTELTSPTTSATVSESREDDVLTRKLLTLWRALKPAHRLAGIEALQMVVALAAEFEELRVAVSASEQQARDDDARLRDDTLRQAGAESRLRRLERATRAPRTPTAAVPDTPPSLSNRVATTRGRGRKTGVG